MALVVVEVAAPDAVIEVVVVRARFEVLLSAVEVGSTVLLFATVLVLLVLGCRSVRGAL